MRNIVSSFLRRRGIPAGAIIGMAGDASSSEDTQRLKAVVDDALDTLKDLQAAILVSGTEGGVPGFATVRALELGLPVIKVYPSPRADKFQIPAPQALTLPILPRLDDSEWGDDTEVFVKLAAGIIFAGGRAGTLVEIAHFAKINDGRARHLGEPDSPPPIYGVPVASFGGWSDRLANEPKLFFADGRERVCLPEDRIENGRAAAVWLAEKINIKPRA
jgi:hypothetical protein